MKWGVTSVILKDLFDFFINLWFWRIYRQDKTRRIGFMFDRLLINNFGITSDLLFIDQKFWVFDSFYPPPIPWWFMIHSCLNCWSLILMASNTVLFTNEMTGFWIDYLYFTIWVYGIAGSYLIYWLLLFGGCRLAQRHSHNFSIRV